MAPTERTTSRQIAVATLARRSSGTTGRSTMRCRITAPPSLLRSPRSRTWIRRMVGAATDRRSLRLRRVADQNAQDRCGQRGGANVYGDQKDDQPALALLKPNLERPVSSSACIVFIGSSSTATLRSIQPADFQQSPLDLLQAAAERPSLKPSTSLISLNPVHEITSRASPIPLMAQTTLSPAVMLKAFTIEPVTTSSPLRSV